MDKLILNSPAKINLGLNIIEKRPDNYHNIETIFYPISLSDHISIEKSDSFSLTTNIPGLPVDNSNLIVKAYNLLSTLSNHPINVKIHLHKNIPMGAGLGGGSSNAASTLTSLIKMFNLSINKDQLTQLALSLGSDVPFFIDPLPSFAQLRGEKLHQIKLKLTSPILILNPGIHVDTKWAYQNITPNSISSLSAVLSMEHPNFNLIKPLLKNDFEPVVFKAHPLIAQLKEELYFYKADFALMTGSGSTLFAIYPDPQSANKAINHFNKNYFTYLHYEKL